MGEGANSIIVEGDFAKVKLELRAGPAEAKPKRPGPGSMLVWGGTGLSSPCGHLVDLIEKSGGQVSFTQVHAAAFEEHAPDLPRPSGAPGPAPMAEEPAQQPVEEEKKEDGAEAKQKPASAPAQSAGEDHHSGPAGSGPMFQYGATFNYNGEEARVWAHPRAAHAGPRPLIILLHGLNESGDKHPSLGASAGKTGANDKWIHVGKLAEKLIDEGKVTPLLIAAPTHKKGNGVFSNFELDKFVNLVEQTCRAEGVEIDLDQVSLAAHSGAGGFPGAGLNKVAAQGAMFSGHKLRVFGIEDTRIIAPAAKEYVENLKKANNDVTAIYAVHRGTGGWATAEYNANGGSAKFAAALGASKKADAFVGNECLEDYDDIFDNGEEKPARVSIKVKEAKLGKYHAQWEAAGGYYKHGRFIAHNDMVPMWVWLALPRFHPQTEADKKLMAAHQEAKKDAPPAAPPPAPKAPAGPPKVTGGDFDIPAAPPAWTNPAGEIAPKATGAARFAPADAAVFWPVRAEKHDWKRGVHYIGEDNATYNYKGKGGSGCHFLAGRAPNRFHVGIDINFGARGALVVACEAGKILSSYPFLMKDGKGVSCILVEHDSGIVINYGEVDAGSLKEFNLKVGDRVQAGQPIGRVGRCPEGDSMLHFETYPAAVIHAKGPRNIRYEKSNGEKYLENFFNPTAYLLYLAKFGR